VITSWREVEAGITFPEGFATAGVRCGLKTSGEDFALVVSESEASVAGLFTTNKVQGACVRYSRRVVRGGAAQAVVINAGNANTCNGEQGDTDNRTMADWVSRHLHIPPDRVITASTGVIGHLLPMENVRKGVDLAVSELDSGRDADVGAASAIMTTDTYAKYRAAEADADGWVAPIRLGGMCKGAGMIAPNMATMLAFVTTDARIPAPLLQEALRRACDASFNRVTVDGDTSTNDMCILMASGMGNGEISRAGDAFEDFVQALTRLCTLLAKELARDGEGATKLVEVRVNGAVSAPAAHAIARTIAESPLVKTALYGNDPNWGRVLMAAGRAGVPFDPDQASLFIGDIAVFKSGTGMNFDRDAAHDYLTNNEIVLTLDAGMGDFTDTMWTCDYSYDYIKINAEYHT
jgi:glutamate N-acetyltransferase/amino-acid N-acetyltransferase